MKNVFLWIVLLSSALYGDSRKENKRERYQGAVTYDLAGGRFGDQLLGYFHAKWISYVYNLPFLYRPFIYSDQLVMHYEEKHFKEEDRLKFFREIHPMVGMQVNYKLRRILYVIPYFPESKWEINNCKGWYYFPVDWRDEGFRKELKKMICPVDFTPVLELPQDRITVAVHIRKGGGFDQEDTWKGYPMKFPPDTYYVEQVRKIYEIFGKAPLYVYAFTDDPNPENLIENYKRQLSGLDIEFDCRKKGNRHDSNVIQDFFEMTRFDCLIRGDSNYSIAASKIADYQVVISPVHFVQRGGTIDSVYIDEVEIEMLEDVSRLEQD